MDAKRSIQKNSFHYIIPVQVSSNQMKYKLHQILNQLVVQYPFSNKIQAISISDHCEAVQHHKLQRSENNRKKNAVREHELRGATRDLVYNMFNRQMEIIDNQDCNRFPHKVTRLIKNLEKHALQQLIQETKIYQIRLFLIEPLQAFEPMLSQMGSNPELNKSGRQNCEYQQQYEVMSVILVLKKKKRLLLTLQSSALQSTPSGGQT